MKLVNKINNNIVIICCLSIVCAFMVYGAISMYKAVFANTGHCACEECIGDSK